MDGDRRIRRIAVVGGGMAGWLAACVLGRKLGGQCSVHLVETPEAAAPGHGEVTMPQFLELLRFVGIEQNDFIDKTQSTYNLGAKFVDWLEPASSYWHPHGALGALIERRPFYHFWHKARALGLKPRIEHFNQEIAFSLGNRFIFPTNSLGVASHLRYSLHIDRALAVRYVRSFAERSGVIRLERKVVSASRLGEGDRAGHLEELTFEDGGKLRADLFIDCTGARAQLIGEFLGVGFDDWKKWLPCDRLVSLPTMLEDARPPYVRYTARAAGWQWRLPLQQNASHGQVYSSAHQSDDEALRELVEAAGAERLGEPRRAEFTSGRRHAFWEKNVVALGDSAGALEPLAATELHFASHALFNLLDHFPDKQFDPNNIASYNAGIGEDLERIRDFTLLHYCLSRREDSPFWRHWKETSLPASLAARIEGYRATGRVHLPRAEVFSDLDWFWIFEGMGVVPRDYDPLVDALDFEQVKRLMLAISQKVSADVVAAPSHDSFFASANARLAGARKAAAAAAPAPAQAPAS